MPAVPAPRLVMPDSIGHPVFIYGCRSIRRVACLRPSEGVRTPPTNPFSPAWKRGVFCTAQVPDLSLRGGRMANPAISTFRLPCATLSPTKSPLRQEGVKLYHRHLTGIPIFPKPLTPICHARRASAPTCHARLDRASRVQDQRLC